MSTLPAIIDTPMGRIGAQITVANSIDLARVQAGELGAETVRTVTLDDVLVDTGATLLCLPADIIATLGLPVLDDVPIATATGPSMARLFSNAQLAVMGRRATVDVLELPAGTTPLLGVTPLEILGIELDLGNRRLFLLPREPANTYLTVL